MSQRKHFHQAFTIVELLIVIVIIGILATLTIVGYNLVRQRADTASLQADLKQAVNQLRVYEVDNGRYPDTLGQLNAGTGLKYNSLIGYQYTANNAASPPTFCITATKGTIAYNSDPTASPIVGVCAGHTAPSSGPVPGETTLLSTGGNTSGGRTCSVYNQRAYCWGNNNPYGQLGNNTTTSSNVPVAVNTSGVLSGKNVTSIVVGNDEHTCAVADGAAYCWGYNNYGQLGNNSTAFSMVPVAVDATGVLAGKVVTQVAVGGESACALASGQLYCWGRNFYGNLGNGNTTNSLVPVAVNMAGVLAGKTVTAIDSYYYHYCVLASGQAYCWGYGANGRMGHNATTDSSVPVAVNTAGVLAGKTVTYIDVGSYSTCAVANGAAYCWGSNNVSYGNLGNNLTPSSSNVPVAVDASGVLAGKTVTQISAGSGGTCAIANDKVYCWGYNNYGAVGNGTTTPNALVPMAVTDTGVLSGKTITSVATGVYRSCVLAGTQPYCWGNNGNGAIGNGTNSDISLPAAVNAYP